MINNCLNGKNLPVYGDGMQIRDWLYVEDHCAAIAHGAGEGRHRRGVQYRAATTRRLISI